MYKSWDLRCPVCGFEKDDLIWNDEFPICEKCGKATMEKMFSAHPLIIYEYLGGSRINHGDTIDLVKKDGRKAWNES